MRRSVVVLLLVLGLCAVGVSNAAAASCGSLRNPFAGSRFADVSIGKIRSSGVSCSEARRVATGAMRRALVMRAPASGIRRFSWDGYRVRGDVRSSPDRFTARSGRRQVTWTV